MNPAKVSAVLVALLCFIGCATNEAPGPKKSSMPITVHSLECDEPTLGKMITRCVLEALKDGCNSEVTLSDDVQAGLVIKGMIARKDISTGGGASFGTVSGTNLGVFGGGGSRSNSFAGAIVEGITLIAHLDGKEIESATYFQTVEKGEYQSPQQVAEEVTDELIEKLENRGLTVER